MNGHLVIGTIMLLAALLAALLAGGVVWTTGHSPWPAALLAALVTPGLCYAVWWIVRTVA